MSKKSKVLARERRRSEKAKKRSANRAKYESMAGTEANKKKKGDTAAGTSRFKHMHNVIFCRKCWMQKMLTKPICS